MRAAIYTRVSTDGQEENFSLPTQLEACRRYAERAGMEIVAELDDVASGALLARPGLARLRELARTRQIDAVVFYAVDRLSRKLAHTLVLRDEFRSWGCELHSAATGQAKDTPEGDLLGNVEALIAEYERLKIKERTQRGKRGKVESGRILGHGLMAPYGYRYTGEGRDKQLEIVPEEAEIVRWMFGWYASGMSTRDVTSKLTELAIPTPAVTRPVQQRKRAMGQWGTSTVLRILRSSTYAGQMQHFRLRSGGTLRPKEDWVSVTVPAIIDRALWDTVQSRLSAGRAMSKRNTKHEYLLAKRIRCECDHAVAGEMSKGVRQYRCTNRGRLRIGQCNIRRGIKADRLESIVLAWLEESLNPERLKNGIETELNMAASQRAELDSQIERLERQRESLDIQVQRLIDGFQAGVLQAHELASRRAALDTSMQRVDQELAAMRAMLESDGPSDEDINALLAIATELHGELLRLGFTELRHILNTIDLRLTVEQDGDGQRWVNIQGKFSLSSERLPIDGVMTRSCLCYGQSTVYAHQLVGRIPIDSNKRTDRA